MKTRIYAAPASKGLRVNTRTSGQSNSRLILPHRLRRWANINLALVQRLLFAGPSSTYPNQRYYYAGALLILL